MLPFLTPTYKDFHYQYGHFRTLLGPFYPRTPLPVGGYGGGLRRL